MAGSWGKGVGGQNGVLPEESEDRGGIPSDLISLSVN